LFKCIFLNLITFFFFAIFHVFSLFSIDKNNYFSNAFIIFEIFILEKYTFKNTDFIDIFLRKVLEFFFSNMLEMYGKISKDSLDYFSISSIDK